MTLDGVASPDDVLTFADPAPGVTTRRTATLPAVPMVVRTAAKDLKRAYAARARRESGAQTQWADHELAFVWQHHDLFQSPGVPIARRNGCPLVSFVDAPLVWEARRWGVKRPGWSHLVERYGEWPQLRASDVVACLTDEIAREIVRLGVPRERIIFSPTAVDADQFAPAAPRGRCAWRWASATASSSGGPGRSADSRASTPSSTGSVRCTGRTCGASPPRG